MLGNIRGRLSGFLYLISLHTYLLIGFVFFIGQCVSVLVTEIRQTLQRLKAGGTGWMVMPWLLVGWLHTMGGYWMLLEGSSDYWGEGLGLVVMWKNQQYLPDKTAGQRQSEMFSFHGILLGLTCVSFSEASEIAK